MTMNEKEYPYLFSVITVCRNAEKTIAQTLQSVRAQSFSNYEHLIIDGVSTDSTLEICERERTPQTAILSEPDNGIYDAMNKAVRMSKGEYLFFLNADDSFSAPSVLETAANYLKTHKPDLLTSDVILVDEHRNETYNKLPPATLFNILRGKYCHQAIFARKDLFARYGSFKTSFRIMADYDWLLRISLKKATAQKLNLAFAKYFSGGLSGISECKGEESDIIRSNNLDAFPASTLVRIEKIVRPIIKALRIPYDAIATKIILTHNNNRHG